MEKHDRTLIVGQCERLLASLLGGPSERFSLHRAPAVLAVLECTETLPALHPERFPRELLDAVRDWALGTVGDARVLEVATRASASYAYTGTYAEQSGMRVASVASGGDPLGAAMQALRYLEWAHGYASAREGTNACYLASDAAWERSLGVLIRRASVSPRGAVYGQ